MGNTFQWALVYGFLGFNYYIYKDGSLSSVCPSDVSLGPPLKIRAPLGYFKFPNPLNTNFAWKHNSSSSRRLLLFQATVILPAALAQTPWPETGTIFLDIGRSQHRIKYCRLLICHRSQLYSFPALFLVTVVIEALVTFYFHYYYSFPLIYWLSISFCQI